MHELVAVGIEMQPCGAASTLPRFNKIFNASVAAAPAHSWQPMMVDGPRRSSG
jgi:hypothetical protein